MVCHLHPYLHLHLRLHLRLHISVYIYIYISIHIYIYTDIDTRALHISFKSTSISALPGAGDLGSEAHGVVAVEP